MTSLLRLGDVYGCTRNSERTSERMRPMSSCAAGHGESWSLRWNRNESMNVLVHAPLRLTCGVRQEVLLVTDRPVDHGSTEPTSISSSCHHGEPPNNVPATPSHTPGT